MSEPTDSHVDALRQQVESLGLELRKLEERVALLENKPSPAASTDSGVASAMSNGDATLPAAVDGTARVEEAAAAAAKPEDPWSTDYLDPATLFRSATLFGRTLVVLGGGYLLRAFTDAQLLPAYLGVIAGLAYACLWLVFAARSTSDEQRASASFHAFAASAIAFPLIAETTIRFRLVGAPAASCILAVFCLMGAVVARMRSSSLIAWICLLGGVVTSLALVIGTRDLPRPTLALLALAVAVEALANTDKGGSWRWPLALALDLQLLLAISIAATAGGLPEGYAPYNLAFVMAVATAALVAHLASVAWRTLRHARPIAAFDAVHLAALIAVLCYGAVQGASDTSVAVAGAIAIASAIACYVVAFGSVDRRHGRGALFYYFGSSALLLAVSGGWMLLGSGALAACCLVLVPTAAWVGSKYDRATVRLHAAAYLTVAVLASGLAARSAEGLLGSPIGPWPAVGLLAYAAAFIGLAAFGLFVGLGPHRPGADWFSLLPDTLVAAWAGWGLAGLSARLVLAAAARAPGPDADAGLVAALRTAVLAVLVTILASLARRLSRRELRWLTYAVLAAGALKLVAEDLRVGRPATLFVALALYGGALFAAPKWMKAGSGRLR